MTDLNTKKAEAEKAPSQTAVLQAKGYKVRLYPTNVQEQKLLQTLGACRFVWNHFLNKRNEAYRNGIKNSTYTSSKEITQLRKEYEWLGEVNYQILEKHLRRLDLAYQSFFSGRTRLPRLKTKKNLRQSFKKPSGWRIQGNRLSITKGLLVRFRGTLPSEFLSKTLTVSLDVHGHWYASAIGTVERTKAKRGKSIGIDLGLTHLAVTSVGDEYKNLKPRKAQIVIEKKLQRSLSRKEKGSQRYKAAKSVLARLHRKTSNRRLNHLHQTSHRITRAKNKLIVCEDLAVKNMQKNHCLAGSIADTGWGEFIRQLRYKQEWRGGQFRVVDRFFPSSKTCSGCGHVLDSLPLNVRQWTCPKCNAVHDRDVNAARNILKEGLRNSRSVESKVGSTKRKVASQHSDNPS